MISNQKLALRRQLTQFSRNFSVFATVLRTFLFFWTYLRNFGDCLKWRKFGNKTVCQTWITKFVQLYRANSKSSFCYCSITVRTCWGFLHMFLLTSINCTVAYMLRIILNTPICLLSFALIRVQQRQAHQEGRGNHISYSATNQIFITVGSRLRGRATGVDGIKGGGVGWKWRGLGWARKRIEPEFVNF